MNWILYNTLSEVFGLVKKVTGLSTKIILRDPERMIKVNPVMGHLNAESTYSAPYRLTGNVIRLKKKPDH
ncbi:MAG: hypothetical protein WD077_08485 [Bacteroidia bacterium]